jgi:hypothetical protein
MRQQGINPLTLIAIVGLLLFWGILFYLSHKTQNIVDNSGSSQKDQLIKSIK